MRVRLVAWHERWCGLGVPLEDHLLTAQHGASMGSRGVGVGEGGRRRGRGRGRGRKREREGERGREGRTGRAREREKQRERDAVVRLIGHTFCSFTVTALDSSMRETVTHILQF